MGPFCLLLIRSLSCISFISMGPFGPLFVRVVFDFIRDSPQKRYVAGGAMAVAGSGGVSSSGGVDAGVVAPAPRWRPSLTLRNVTFVENGAGCWGGAVYAHDVDGIVT
jgi:predicted outer membrane repeat protein